MSTFWLIFCQPDLRVYISSALVQGSDLEDATTRAADLGLFPSVKAPPDGTVWVYQIPPQLLVNIDARPRTLSLPEAFDLDERFKTKFLANIRRWN